MPFIYVNGLSGLPSGSKVYLRRARAGISINFTGDAGDLDDATVLAAIAEEIGSAPTWDALTAYAATAPQPRRGPSPGSRASAAPRIASALADDFDALDTDMGANPFPEPTKLVVDHREPREMVERLRTVRNLEVEVAQLEIGDYVATNHDNDRTVMVERKTVNDLVQSIVGDDKRFFHQATALAAGNAISLFLIEGDPYRQDRLSIRNIDGALSYLMVVKRLPVLFSRSLPHSAALIAKVVRHGLYGLGYPDPGGSRSNAPQDPRVASAYLLTSIPGVSATIAARLVAAFGSVAGVCAASEADLRTINGIGAKVAANIRLTLTGNADTTKP